MNDINKIFVFDTTLRDGMQSANHSLSIDEKLMIIDSLEQLGIDYIEAGFPSLNDKDYELFTLLMKKPKSNSKFVAFTRTRKKNTNIDDDYAITMLKDLQIETIAVVGKTSIKHVKDILNTDPQENLNMIYDTVKYLKNIGIEVIYDAEHFFDAYKIDPIYALSTLKSAQNAGANVIVLCDTNGGSLPYEIFDACQKVYQEFNGISIGIHAHNDGGVAVANSLSAVKAGINHVQGTFFGIGERCGNANLITLIANLSLKLGYSTIPSNRFRLLTPISKSISQVIKNVDFDSMPFVGSNAFAHKGGMHIDAVMKASWSYELIDPNTIGNSRRFITSELSGVNAIKYELSSLFPGVSFDNNNYRDILNSIKKHESKGYEYREAKESYILLIHEVLGFYERKIYLTNVITNFTNNMYEIEIEYKLHNQLTMSISEKSFSYTECLQSIFCKIYSNFIKQGYPEIKKYTIERSIHKNKQSISISIVNSTIVDSSVSTVGVGFDDITSLIGAYLDSYEYAILISSK